MEKAPKRKQNERPFLRLENTKNAQFCPFLYFKVPKRTKIGKLRSLTQGASLPTPLQKEFAETILDFLLLKFSYSDVNTRVVQNIKISAGKNPAFLTYYIRSGLERSGFCREKSVFFFAEKMSHN